MEKIQQIVDLLDQHIDDIDFAKSNISKIENASEKSNKTSEIILVVPGDDIVVKKTAASFEESLDLCADAAKKLLIKKKEMA